MDNNQIKEKITEFIKSKNKVKLFVAIGIIGIILILMSEIIPQGTGETKSSVPENEDSSYSEYVVSLEEKTQDIVGSIEGVGNCKVMITLKDTNESVFAKNSEENKDNSSYSKNYEYVLYDGQDGETPVLVKQYFPQVQGVAIVCEGADNTVVRESIINSVSSLFNIPTSRISVSKIMQER